MPVAHRVFVEFPAEAYDAAVTLTGKIHQSLLEALEVDAEFPQLDQVTLDLGGQPLDLGLEGDELARWRIGAGPRSRVLPRPLTQGPEQKALRSR
jgi:hypothetical protein